MSQEEEHDETMVFVGAAEAKGKTPQEILAGLGLGHDPVNRPKHYTSHPSGIECIQVTEHMSFCIGNAVKYLWRYDRKGGVEDLEKARWYIGREIERRKSDAVRR